MANFDEASDNPRLAGSGSGWEGSRNRVEYEKTRLDTYCSGTGTNRKTTTPGLTRGGVRNKKGKTMDCIFPFDFGGTHMPVHYGVATLSFCFFWIDIQEAGEMFCPT
jgi:hypothetical protein